MSSLRSLPTLNTTFKSLPGALVLAIRHHRELFLESIMCTSPATPGCRPAGSCSATPRASSIATSDAIMWDQKTGRSRGSGFVSFRNQQNAQTAINELMVHSLLLIASNV